jgi:hypothetical protein
MCNCHKLVQGRPAQNGIEGEAELRDVEQDIFHAEVLMRPECDREGDTSARNDRYRAHLGEWARRLEFQHRYLQHFESCQADQIQCCTTIDKDVVQLDVDDKQRELPSLSHALRAVRGVEADRCLHPPVVWGRPWGRRSCRHLSTQVLDDATGGDVPRASEHNVVTGLRVRMTIYGLEIPFGFLEPHSVLLVLFRVYLLFALPLAGRRAVTVLLLQLLVVLFYEFLDLPTLLGAVAHGVVH